MYTPRSTPRPPPRTSFLWVFACNKRGYSHSNDGFSTFTTGKVCTTLDKTFRARAAPSLSSSSVFTSAPNPWLSLVCDAHDSARNACGRNVAGHMLSANPERECRPRRNPGIRPCAVGGRRHQRGWNPGVRPRTATWPNAALSPPWTTLSPRISGQRDSQRTCVRVRPTWP